MEREYQICTKCVMDTSDPDIHFNENGVCNHCILYEKKMSAFLTGKERDTQLEALINKIKKSGEGKEYDCVIGISGGVDSTYVAYKVKEFGLRPLAIHLDNGWNSELSVKNIENILKRLDIDLYTHVIDWEEFKDLQLSFLKASTPDSEIPTDHAIFSLLRHLAAKMKVSYIITGINQKTESHHPLKWSQGHADWKYIKSVHKQFGSTKLSTYPHGNFLTLFKELYSKNWINILNYMDYSKYEAKQILAKEFAWNDYGGKHYESIYTRFYQGYILPKKFGYDKRKMHLSSLICGGEITRQEALEELKKEPYSRKLQEEDKIYVIKKLGITEGNFEEIMKLPLKTYADYPSYYNELLTNKYLKKAIKFVKGFRA